MARLIALSGFASSNSEARRLVSQGAVRLDQEKVTDPRAEVVIRQGTILKVGKLRIGKLSW